MDSALQARLRAHRVLDLVEDLAAHHGVDAGDALHGAGEPTRAIFVDLRGRGWSAANLERVFGLRDPNVVSIDPPTASATLPHATGPLFPTPDQLRSRRPRDVGPRTESIKRLPKHELQLGAALYPERPGDDYQRPRDRSECRGGLRPCPFVSCAHHLYLDVTRHGAIKLNFPDLEVWEMPETCALDVADRGGATLEDVGALLNVTRERVRQMEVNAFARITRRHEGKILRDFAEEGTATKRRLPILEDDKSDPEAFE